MFSHFVLKISFNYPAVSNNASAFQGTHSRRFSGRSWSSPTNFAVSDLSGVPNVSAFNGPFVRLGLEPNMVGESEKHKFILVHFVGSMQPIFSCFINLSSISIQHSAAAIFPSLGESLRRCAQISNPEGSGRVGRTARRTAVSVERC